MREDTSSERFTLLLKMIARWIAPSKDNSSFTSSHWLPPVLNSPSETSLSVTEIPSVIAFKTSLNYARRHNNQFFSLMYGSTPNILRLLKGTGSSCFRKKNEDKQKSIFFERWMADGEGEKWKNYTLYRVFRQYCI